LYSVLNGAAGTDMIATAPGEDHSPHSQGAGMALWVVLGLACYGLASLAIVPLIANSWTVPLFLGVAMASPALAVGFVSTGTVISPVLGYVALRYWGLPSRASRQHLVAMPVLILLAMILVIPICAVVTSLVAAAAFLSARASGFSLLMTVTPVASSALAGLGLWGVERVASHLVFGGNQARELGARLCCAHVVGLAALALAIGLAMSARTFFGFTSPVVIRVLLDGLRLGGAVLHLLLTWRAWSGGPMSPVVTVRAVTRGCITASLALILVGAAVRLPSNGGILGAMFWLNGAFTRR